MNDDLINRIHEMENRPNQGPNPIGNNGPRRDINGEECHNHPHNPPHNERPCNCENRERRPLFLNNRHFLSENEMLIGEDIERQLFRKQGVIRGYLDKCLSSCLNSQTKGMINLEKFIVLYALFGDNPEFEGDFKEIIYRIKDNFIARKTRIRVLTGEIPSDRELIDEFFKFNK